MIVNESSNTKKVAEKRRFHGLAGVKNVTKLAAKKFNRIFEKAKSKLTKSTTKEVANVSIVSTSTQFTDVDFYDEEVNEFEEVNFKNTSNYLSCDTLPMDNWNDGFINYQNTLNDSGYSKVPDLSFHSDTSSFSSNSMSRIFAESIADLNMICERNQKEITIEKPNREKKIIRKGTPYKLKMPYRLTLYDDSPPEMTPSHTIQVDENEDEDENQCNDALNKSNKRINDKENEPRSKCDLKRRFSQKLKESFVKRIYQNVWIDDNHENTLNQSFTTKFSLQFLNFFL